MFLENKYTKLYYKLTSQSDTEGYTEKHHIIPVCLGGSDDTSNIVRISARKHFLCHYLLIKMIDRSPAFWKLLHALNGMQRFNKHQIRYFNSRLYEKHKKEFAEFMSISQSGSGNSQFGTTWIYCPMTLTSRKVPKTEIKNYIEKGCVKGRIQSPEKFIQKNKLHKKRRVYKIDENNKKQAIDLFNHFKKSGLSYKKYTEKYLPNFHFNNIYLLFKRYDLTKKEGVKYIFCPYTNQIKKVPLNKVSEYIDSGWFLGRKYNPHYSKQHNA